VLVHEDAAFDSDAGARLDERGQKVPPAHLSCAKP
jgi:hypothetical protein